VLNAWCLALGRCLRPRGSLTLIVPAAHLTASLSALSAARCAEISIYPLWPRHGVAAKLVILRAIHQGRGPTRLLAGLVLHQANGAYTSAAEALLRDGACLEF
jgi:tRNA1(Val) A37 N6-methylase TrmN6